MNNYKNSRLMSTDDEMIKKIIDYSLDNNH